MSAWPITPLKGHIAEVSMRKGEAPAEIFSVTNTVGFVRSLDVFDKQVFSQDARNYKLVRFNDLAYNPSRINVGSVAICHFPEGGAVSPMYVVVRCRDSLLPQLLLYFLKSGIGRQQIAHRCVGAVRFMLRFGDLEQMELPLPPVSEQPRIVRILDDADALRRLRAESDERTNRLTEALFGEMFGSPASTAGRWEAATLASLGTVVTGN
ncbi:MAG TPA: restriction endonuclease subunit S, partial [Terracidiphilus sp.]|nr:restriction endonuclease subunit S [Terracidiphilus sp.]